MERKKMNRNNLAIALHLGSSKKVHDLFIYLEGYLFLIIATQSIYSGKFIEEICKRIYTQKQPFITYRMLHYAENIKCKLKKKFVAISNRQR